MAKHAAKRGFMPCFSNYLFAKYPIANVYGDTVYIDKIKNLLSSLVESENPMILTRNFGVGKEIQPIRPDSLEGKRLIAEVDKPVQLYRIDYGNTPFRVIFYIQNDLRIAHIVIFDTKHATYSGKNKR